MDSIKKSEQSKRVVVAGATGFIGKALGKHLMNHQTANHTLIGLSRSLRKGDGAWDTFRQCDLFSLRQTINALEGADIGIYLVHSMMPSARLTQGHFSDLDLLCADNFGRAAAKAGLKQIIYLGGILPSKEDQDLSSHLMSRNEVEQVLKRHGIPVTTLRAGLIIGREGSSFQMLLRLVSRLPLMVCPSWTQTPTQPVCLEDVLDTTTDVIGNTDSIAKTYDMGIPEVVTYQDLIIGISEQLKKKTRIIPFPFLSPKLSRLWISLTTGAPKSLVAPLIESLKHEMLVRPEYRISASVVKPTSLRDALRKAMSKSYIPAGLPHAFTGAKRNAQSLVRSVQRMSMPTDKDASWLAEQYNTWLMRSFKGLINVVQENGRVQFRTLLGNFLLIELQIDESLSDSERVLYRVTKGGLVSGASKGKFEFRLLGPDLALVALHNFTPALPWWIYRWTQALFHARTMRRFTQYISSCAESASVR